MHGNCECLSSGCMNMGGNADRIRPFRGTVFLLYGDAAVDMY